MKIKKKENIFVRWNLFILKVKYAQRIDNLEQDKRIVSAFRYANNILKHSIEVKEITEEVGGIEFPIEFSLGGSESPIIIK